MNAKLAILAFVSLFLFFGCIGLDEATGGRGTYPAADYDYSTKAEYAPASPEMAYYSSYGASGDYPAEQMVIKGGSATLDVEAGTLEEKKDMLYSLADEYRAEVSSARFNEYSTETRYAITVKLSPHRFDEFVSSLSSLGKITHMDTSMEDVTEQYVDIQTRISNLETELARLNALYDKADTVEEILMIEREVARVQTQLELYQNRAQDLERRAAKSTLTVYLVEKKPALETDFVVPLAEILGLFLGAMIAGIMLVVGLAGFIIPIAIAAVVLRAIYLALRGRGKGKNKDKDNEKETRKQK